MLHMGRTSASLSFINGIDCMPYQAALSVVNEWYICVFPCLKRFCLKRRIHQQKCVQICIEGKVWNMFLKEGEKNGNGIYIFSFFHLLILFYLLLEGEGYLGGFYLFFFCWIWLNFDLDFVIISGVFYCHVDNHIRHHKLVVIIWHIKQCV